ncbi:MAG: thioredoxin domain-containing protein [Clostridia bacterium]|nr:thioredoxin domain-containing protein [Clostridia bacterium]
MKNRLKESTSPYLMQHADNPVHWYPWCEEAFERAKSEDKPVFLSIGYSACHWCHVMAHESFEDEQTARFLNEHFISVKVDREERPDIDSVYMEACIAISGSGGWPMSVFLTPDKKPFFAGTYFPKEQKYGMPSFLQLLETVQAEWKMNRDGIVSSAEEAVRLLSRKKTRTKEEKGDIIKRAADDFLKSYDDKNGGFGMAPKFPMPHNLIFLLLYGKQMQEESIIAMAEHTLMQMRKGGIFDHIGYGFSRYSTDEKFLAPHFEKMLYDNALLIMAYAVAYDVTKNEIFLLTAEQTAEYIRREMTNEKGGFYSAQDADVDGEEGKFYTFTQAEIDKVLEQSQAARFKKAFDVTEQGNFEGTNILNLLKSGALTEDFEAQRQAMFAYRKQRAKLHTDDKILTAWNALTIAAFAMLYRISKKERYLKAACDAQSFIEAHLTDGETIFASYREKVGNHGFLDDYAFWITALIEMYHATLDKKYLEKAEFWCAVAEKKYKAPEGGFFLCPVGEEGLFKNPMETQDGAIPCGNSVMAYNLLRLYAVTENTAYKSKAEEQIEFLKTAAQSYPAAHTVLLLAMLLQKEPLTHIRVVSGENGLSDLKNMLPFMADITISEDTKNMPCLDGQTTYYVCRRGTCAVPTTHL